MDLVNYCPCEQERKENVYITDNYTGIALIDFISRVYTSILTNIVTFYVEATTTTTTTFIATVIHVYHNSNLNIKLNDRRLYIFYKWQEHIQVM